MTDTTHCYHCGSDKINKAGFTKNKKQRYYCRSCRRFSRENPVLKKDNENKIKIRTKALPSKSHLVLQLQATAQRLGKTPTTSDIAELSKIRRAFPLHVYYEVFGSFTGAIKKARLKPRYKQEFDKDKLIDELRALRRKLRRALIAKDVAKARKRGEVSFVYHFQRAFGSVPNAIAAAGAARRKFTDVEIITYLKTLHRELGHVPTGKDIAKRFVLGETPSFKEVLKTFGTLKRARRAAGIAYRLSKDKNSINWQKYTPEELVEQMRRLSEELGRNPTDRDLNKASKAKKCASSTTFRRVFGGLEEAYRQSKVKTQSF